ncbi:(2,3-dihydroxybenzoyl)adenylate synthase [Paenibacillus sp. HWE-109]|uniref:(2,3-dihydroxybenzoyl)adenylate synthase n=1 Tax=Paenibacillus sp. HWE-109 TaxID=1306526 RepID=UPI001EDF98FE|nr:(2,3-dihydroxybenzoyl)adenylate synthase [Paenibacillus sp. HWE-109]UKS24695.1 (2,3-dihydroxybenzoyl)adenylate synthase [Paenibacillus sp. HWE-109]
MLTNCPTWPDEWAQLYREEGLWQGLTLGDMLTEQARVHSERIAVVSGEQRLSYETLNQRAQELAAGLLTLGVKQYDRVIVQLPNIGEFFIVVFALFKIGAIPVFALPAHRHSEISYLSEFSEAVAYVIQDQDNGFDYRELANAVKDQVATLEHVLVVGDPGLFRSLDSLYQLNSEVPSSSGWPEVKASDVAFLQLSGGSTGLPKLIPRTHDDYMYSFRRSNEVCGMNEESVYLAALPVAHNFPLSSPGVLGTLLAGGRIVMASRPSPDDAFPLIAKERVTITALVPPLALIWMEAAASRSYDLSSLKVLQVGGAKFSEEAARRVKPELGCTLQQVFGMAEGLVNYTRLDDSEDVIVSTQGRPMSAWDEVRVVDEDGVVVKAGEVGELWTRGPYTIRGYYKAEAHNAKSFTEDGFYKTGDLVMVNEAGYLVVEGRAKDQINRGGDKIAAEEVENHLLSHPGVYDAALVSMPDPFLGERSCAFVIPRGDALSVAELKNYLRSRGLAPFKIPDRIQFLTAFPQTTVGKVSKKALRESLLPTTV